MLIYFGYPAAHEDDAELTAKIYARVPVLIDESKGKGGNPWGISFMRMFDMSNDSSLFRTAAQLANGGFRREGSDWLSSVGQPMLIAVLVSNVAGRVRTQADTAIGRIRMTEQLYAFSRKLAGTGTLDDVLWATAYQTALMLKVRVVLLLPENGTIAVRAGYPPEDQLDQADLAAANWAWDNDRPAGRAVEGRLPRGVNIARLRDAPAEWSRQFEALGLTPQQ